jgi:hypothetical protein
MAAGLLALLVGATASLAQQPEAAYPGAQASDPVRLGLMVGSPPPSDKRVAYEDGSLRFPQLRWALSAHSTFTVAGAGQSILGVFKVNPYRALFTKQLPSADSPHVGYRGNRLRKRRQSGLHRRNQCHTEIIMILIN